LAQALARGACFHCNNLEYLLPNSISQVKNKFFICLSDFDLNLQKVPIAICTSQDDHKGEKYCITLSSTLFPKATFVNLRFVQMMNFEFFKNRALAREVEKYGDIDQKDIEAIINATKIYPIPTDSKRREEWQAILLLIRPDLSIDLT
jgi:hypothetical protein